MRDAVIVCLKSRIEIAEAVIVRHDCLRERLAEIGADTREIDASLVGLWRHRNLLLQDLRLTETSGGGTRPVPNGRRHLYNDRRDGADTAEGNAEGAVSLRKAACKADG